MRLSAKSRRVVKSGLLRAARTFSQAFLAVTAGAPLLSLSIPTVKAAAVAGIGAVLSLVQRALDETGVPTIPKG